MTTVRQRLMVVLAVAAVGWVAPAGAAPPTTAQVCEAAKLKAAGDKADCLAGEEAKKAKGHPFDFAKCDSTFTKAFTAYVKFSAPPPGPPVPPRHATHRSCCLRS